MATSEVTNKLIQLKDADGNLVYPKILGQSIPNGSVTEAQLSEDVTEGITALYNNITALMNNVLLYEVVS